MQERTDDIGSGFHTRLSGLRRRVRLVELARGAILLSLVVGGTIIAALALEAIFHFGPPARTVMFWTVAGVAAAAVGRFVILPLLKMAEVLPSESDATLAQMVGGEFPEIRDHLLNGLQLLAGQERTPDFYSPELIDAALRDLESNCAGIDFEAAAPEGVSRRLLRILGGAVLCTVLLLTFLPGNFLGAGLRLWEHEREFISPPSLALIITPGDAEVVKGSDVRLIVRIQGEQPSRVVLRSRREGESVPERRVLEAATDSSFAYVFSSLKATTLYDVEAGGVSSREYRLTVIDRPLIQLLRLSLRFPSYSGLPPRECEDNVGDVSVLRGTRVGVSVEANSDLSGAAIVFGDSTSLPLRVRGKAASGEFAVTRDRAYWIRLQNLQGASNAEPIVYTIRVLPDGYPSVAILFPGSTLDVTDQTTVPLLVRITDDFGFSRLRIAHRLVHSRYERPSKSNSFVEVPLPQGVKTEAAVSYPWSLVSLSLVPEDVVEYHVEVFDNDAISGPKSAVSETNTLRVPSLEEVLAGADESHERMLMDMQEAMKEAEEARRALDELRRDLLREQQKPDWQDRNKVEDLAQKYDEVQKRMEDVNKAMERMVNDLQKNQLLSPETLEKYQELQQLMEEMRSPEFAEAMKRLQESLQRMSADEMRRSLERFAMTEEEFRKSLERTVNLLKRIQIEQKLDEMVKRAEAMQKEQEGVRQKSEGARNDSARADAARRQRDLAEEVKRMEEELAALQASMERFPEEMPVAETEKARRGLEESRLQERMQKIARQLESMQTQEALNGQREASGQMQQFARQMRGVKEALEAGQQRQIVNALRRVQQNLLELSRRQEALKKEAQGLDPNSARFRENMQEQAQVMQDLGNTAEALSAVSQKTFSVSPEMGRALGDAHRQMGEAMRALEQRNGSAASQQQGSAMGSLNDAAQQVQAAVNGLLQGSGQGGMGMASLMQRLRQITGEQQGINQATQGLTPQQAAAMSRLAAAQGGVRKSLEELAREASLSGQASRLLGDLRKIAEEMREVQTDLARGDVSSETLRKQERILSRLLDSQRSTQERDFEKRRKAEPGTGVARGSPGPLDLSTQEGKSRLRRDLLRALEEGYARDYQELIKKYFEALER